MFCPNCKQDLDKEKVGFRDCCEKCGLDLHSCLYCCFYLPGKPNDCYVPGTEPVSDKEKYNFCEEFKLLQDSNNQKLASKEDILNKLFKKP